MSLIGKFLLLWLTLFYMILHALFAVLWYGICRLYKEKGGDKNVKQNV